MLLCWKSTNVHARWAERAKARRLEDARELLRHIQRYSTNHRHEGRNQDNVETAYQIGNLDYVPPFPWTPHIQQLLCGTRDEQSTLSVLCGNEDTMIRHIYSYLVEWWESSVTLTIPAFWAGRMEQLDRSEVDFQAYGHTYEFAFDAEDQRHIPAVNLLVVDRQLNILGSTISDRPDVAFTLCGGVDFPPVRGLNVHMLPFIMGDPQSLPSAVKPYYDTVISRCPVEESEIGKVLYLTVKEGYVKAGATLRQAGVHIEPPGLFHTKASFTAGLEYLLPVFERACTPDELHGGTFMASSVSHNCKVWNALIDQPDAVDSHGGLEHLRAFIGNGYKMAADELVWLTERTPQEALPLEEDGYHQFFQLVTSGISVWFAEHSTPNPKVPLPDFVRVV